MGTTCMHVTGLGGNVFVVSQKKYSWIVVLASIWIDLAQAVGRSRKGTIKCRVRDRIRTGNLSWSKVLHPVKSGSEPQS